jgi:molybdate transport system regulatory protein
MVLQIRIQTRESIPQATALWQSNFAATCVLFSVATGRIPCRLWFMERKSTKKTGFTIHPRWRVGTGKKIAMGPGKADLLALIAETGSIGKAAEKMRMSYMRAWSLLKTMNECFESPVLTAERGGSERGGTTLTETGRQVLKLYREMERDSLKAIQPKWRSLQRLLRA